jgi:3-oxoacyl-[acyl-carrier protein] reductase
VARTLAREGACVAICARTRQTLEAAAAKIRADARGPVEPIVADVAVEEDVRRLVLATVERFGGLDVLVTNAGGPPSGTFEELSDADWRAAVDLLLLSVVRLCREALPHLRRRGGGRIIHLTSVAVKQPIERLVLSNAIRAAVVGLSKTLALELARDRITVNCVAPGYTRTDRLVDLARAVAAAEGVDPTVVIERTVRQIPAGRLGEPDELAALVAFLASDHAAYLTGATIQVDGGFVRSLL